MIGGELVREARRRAGISQAELAARAGTTQSAIARLESGRTRPALEQVERLMRWCGFQLIVELAPYDDQDSWQATQLLSLPDEQARTRRLTKSVRTARRLRAFADAG
jgi:transcriptional regulator with XRE-family HTH domain